MKKRASVFLASAVIFMLAVPALAAPNAEPVQPIPSLTPIEPNVPVENVSSAKSDSPAGGSDGYGNPPAADAIVRQSGRGTVIDIEQYWEENGYPADVSYAFKAGGEVIEDQVYDWWEIGLVDADDARRQEILELATPNCLVEFKNALFSHAEKAAAYEKLMELAETDENILSVVFIRNDDTVWVAVPEERAKEYAQYLIRDCGLGAVVSVTDEDSIDTIVLDGELERIPITEGGMAPGGGLDAAISEAAGGAGVVPETRAGAPMYWVYLALAAIAACTLAGFALRRFLVPAAAAEHGGVRANRPLRGGEVVQAVRNSTEVPGSGVYQSILDRVRLDESLPKE